MNNRKTLGEESPVTDTSCEEAQKMLGEKQNPRTMLGAALHVATCATCRKEFLENLREAKKTS